ncbi:MAG TPA: hypothetical protein VG323_00175 [Thermoanaerobaculia bacterium]|nr:hypothetical protein [Thermoanaerobaculia bacterium]
MKRIIIALALLLLATKPCPPDPCPDGCDDKADWIAVGHVTHLEHHWQGMPLNHDFATFTFVVERWIKGGDKLPREIPFQAGWCDNRQSMRDDKGQFKFWGVNGGPPWKYLHFEPVKP